MKELAIYECGRMSGLTIHQMRAWRDCFKATITQVAENIGAKIKVCNPCDYYNFEVVCHQSELEVMKFDLARVKESDLVVVNLDGLNVSIGSIIECYEAWKNDIPVLAFGSKTDYENLHPWIKCCITRVDEDYRECINYISDFYMT